MQCARPLPNRNGISLEGLPVPRRHLTRVSLRGGLRRISITRSLWDTRLWREPLAEERRRNVISDGQRPIQSTTCPGNPLDTCEIRFGIPRMLLCRRATHETKTDPTRAAGPHGQATETGNPLARHASRTLPNAPQIDRRLQFRSPCKRTSGHTQQRTCTTPPPPRRRHHCRRPGRQTALVVSHRSHTCNRGLCLGGAPLHVATVVIASSAHTGSGVRASLMSNQTCTTAPCLEGIAHQVVIHIPESLSIQRPQASGGSYGGREKQLQVQRRPSYTSLHIARNGRVTSEPSKPPAVRDAIALSVFPLDGSTWFALGGHSECQRLLARIGVQP